MFNKISVVIPTYNRIKFLLRAIESVMKQTYPIHEIIVVDNNSSDNTPKIIKDKYSGINVLLQNKQGVSYARNQGIKIANGDWIALLDSDDLWKPEKIEKQLILYENSDKSRRIIHTNELWYRNGIQLNQKNKHKKSGGYIFENCVKLCCISPSSALLRSDLFEDIGYFDVEFPTCEDYDFWLRVSLKEKVLFVDEPLTLKFGGHDDQLSKKYWGMDRFRVKALEKLIFNCSLNIYQKKIVLHTLLIKLKIITDGAKKRKNYEVEEFYRTKIDHWTNYKYENI